nr:hypothetical protein [Spirochaetota bacterium]
PLRGREAVRPMMFGGKGGAVVQACGVQNAIAILQDISSLTKSSKIWSEREGDHYTAFIAAFGS